ncbi:MAG: tripartite tricarboxylate transporter permease, partial [Planctomycetes bacterium]|nr:tripartite tricarboxylate transporter permease [Planctomycetota bacterium]
VVIFGLLGYGMRLTSLPGSSLILGLVLGPMMEEYFRRAMILSRGSFSIFFTRPISCIILIITFSFLCWKIGANIYRQHRAS